MCHIGLRLAWCVLLFGISFHPTLLCSTGMAAHSGIAYEVSIEGIDNRMLRTSLENISNTVTLRRERLPATKAMLRRRVEKDVPRLIMALKAEGYYGAKVTADVDTDAEPVRVTFRVDPGTAYLLKSVEIQTAEGETVLGMELPDPASVGLRAGERTPAQAIIDAQGKILGGLAKDGFPFAKIVKRDVLVDHAEHAVSVTYRLQPGPRARFGATKITGLVSVDEELVRKKIPWQVNDLYNADLLQEAQGRLNALGLFSIVRVTHAKALDEAGRLPIAIAVSERRHRSVGAGIGYKTDEGLNVKTSWEHRNLFSGGERLRLSAGASDFTRAAEGEFRKPAFWRDDQALRLSLRMAEDQPDAYTSKSLRSSVLIDRDLTTRLTVGAGMAFKASRVVQLEDEEHFSLVSLPMYMEWDTSDDVLDPTRGGRLSLQLAPNQDIVETDLSFVKGLVTTSRYVQLSRVPSLVLAGKLALGAITGSERDAIPADERFYAGGGGSIRGYPYQTVGPIEQDEPLGGRSLLEISMEVRWKITEQFGLVAFWDGGSAFRGTRLDSGEDLRWGAGAGLRYFTSVGPLRLDIGIPLNRRPDVDDHFQLYVSLGQAF